MSKKNGNGNGVKITLAIVKERLDNLIERFDEDRGARDKWRVEILDAVRKHSDENINDFNDINKKIADCNSENKQKFDDINADRFRFWGAIVLGGFLVTAVLGWMAIK